VNKAIRTVLIIADQYPIIRWGIHDFLEKQGNIQVLGEAASIPELEEMARRLRPNVIILDMSLPGGNPIELAEALTEDQGIRVVGFGANQAWTTIQKFLASGGKAYVSKNSPLSCLVDAIKASLNNQTYICPASRGTGVTPRDEKSALGDLSAREQEIASLVARGLTSRQIADQLCVSLKTIETHRYRIFKRLKITNRAELVNYVIEHGLLAGAPVIIPVLD
jgi:two-component system, NarL family, response regulator NreC